MCLKKSNIGMVSSFDIARDRPGAVGVQANSLQITANHLQLIVLIFKAGNNQLKCQATV